MSFLDGATGNWLIVSWFLFFHPHSGLDHQPNFLKYWNGERSGILILEGAVVAKRPNVQMLTTLTDWLAYKWKLPTPEIELHCSDVCTWLNKLLSSPIFCCLSVRHRCHPTKSTHFPYIQAFKPFADPVPPNTKQYQLILTKYQPLL